MTKFTSGISILAGTIIGIGLFGLPYVALKVGLPIVIFYFLLLGPVAIIIHLFFAELALNTPDFKRLPGFARIYLGKKAELFSKIIIILALIGTNLAYLILGGDFLNELASPFLGGNELIYTTVYFLIGILIIYFGIKAIAKIQFIGLVLFFFLLVLILLKGIPFFDIKNLAINSGHLKDFFLPYGVVLFSLWGVVIIPEIEESLGKEKHILRKLVITAVMIPIIVSILFTVSMLGITGEQTTESALVGLKDMLGNGAIHLALFFGVLTTFTSFIVLGLTLKKVLWYDFKIPEKISWIIASLSPFLLYLLGLKSFIAVISFVGAVMWATEGILINLMYNKFYKANPGKVKYPKLCCLVYPLTVILILGIVYEIYHNLNLVF